MKQNDDVARTLMRPPKWGCVVVLLIALPLFMVPVFFLWQRGADENSAQERADRLAASFADDLDTLLRSGEISDRQIGDIGSAEKRPRSIKRTGSVLEVNLMVMVKKGSLLGSSLVGKCFVIRVDTARPTDRHHSVTPLENCG